ncbi:MAG: sigma-70 family RNA polymerase sigma factor [Bryobacterales bacterium]|nr:sigma-70 family RNA polymerase sigma factor [Bryobacterales bacterium]
MGTAIQAAAIPGFVKPPPDLEQLYERYAETVYQSALRVTGNSSDAEDALQVVFLRLVNHRLETPGEALDKYFRRAAVNAAIDILRRKKWQAEVELDPAREYTAKESTALLKERIRRSLAKVPPEDAELFVLCYLEGHSYDELAMQMGVERGTIGSRLHRIRAVLKKEMSR